MFAESTTSGRKSATAAVIAPGESYELQATVDVLRDLNSVEKYVKINKV